MNIYLVKRDTPTGYDEYASFVVFAETSLEAQHTHPSWAVDDWDGSEGWGWVNCNQVQVTLLGMADSRAKAGVVCSDYNAG